MGQQGQLRAGLQCADSGRFRSQVIVAAEVTQETNDKKQLLPMIAQIAANLEQKPEKVSADTGYFSEANVTDESVKDVDLYVATGRTSTASRWRPAANPRPLGRLAERCDAGKATNRGWSHRVQDAQGDR